MKKFILQFILLLGLFFWNNESAIFAQTNVANPTSNLNNITTGHSNTLIGDGAGKDITSGYKNTFVGTKAGFSNTTGHYNTFLGKEAGYSLQTTNYNTFIGFEAGKNDSTGHSNVFLGSLSGANNQGSGNTFIGRETGNKNTSGYRNMFIGYRAGKNNINGNYNVFIGSETGSLNTTGQFNVAIGNNSGLSNNGTNNTFLGHASGRDNLSGEDNTFIGMHSGYRNINGSHNTILGKTAGYNSIGSSNVFIGYQAGYNDTSSNKLYISNDTTNNLIYGEFDNKKVGINNTSPEHTLDVGGDFRSEDIYTQNGLKFKTVNEINGGYIDYYEYNGTDTSRIVICPSNDIIPKNNHFVINAEGEVIIGTNQNGAKDIGSTNPCGRLYVNGGTKLYGSLEASNSAFFDKNLTVNDSLIVNGIAFRADGSSMFNTVSDEKLKKNFKNLDKQLPELLKIDLYSYDYKNTGITRYGIKAQEIQKVLPNSVKKFKKDYLSFNPNDLMYMHIRATQELAGKLSEQESIVDELENTNKEQANQISELSQKVDDQNNTIRVQGLKEQKLETRINELEDKLNQLLTLMTDKSDAAHKTEPILNQSTHYSEAQLSQNIPNPSKDQTTINYFIPKGINTASIEVYNLNGQALLSIPIEGLGAGSININISDLGNDNTIYPYTLILDGQKSVTRKMVFVK